MLLSNQKQLRAKSALQSIFLRIQSTSSKRASADAETNSSRSEAASVSAASISDFDAYLNSLYSPAAAEASATRLQNLILLHLLRRLLM